MNKKITTFDKDHKAASKEKRDITHDFEKKIDMLENRNNILLEYKRSKEAESKDLKVQLKNVNKKSKEISRKEAKLELNKLDFEKLKKEKGDKKEKTDFRSVSTQADLKKSLPDTTTHSHSNNFISSLCHTSPPFFSQDITTYPSMVTHLIAKPAQNIPNENQTKVHGQVLEAFTKMYDEMSAKLQTLCELTGGLQIYNQ